MSSPQKGGTSLLPGLPDDNSDHEEAQLSDSSPVITRAAARREAERLTAHQQAQQGPSNSKGKDPERYPNPTEVTPESSSTTITRLESMMERMMAQHALSTRETMERMMIENASTRELLESINKRMDDLEVTRSRRSTSRSHQSSPRSRRADLSPVPLLTPLERLELSKDPPANINPESQHQDPTPPTISSIPNPIPPPPIQPPVLPSTISTTIPVSPIKRDQSLEDALTKSRADRLA